jgi:outer membrane protein TolC
MNADEHGYEEDKRSFVDPRLSAFIRGQDSPRFFRQPAKLAIRFLMAAWLCAVTGLAQPHAGPPVSFQNSARLHDLMRAGNLYLSLQDALALAIENNLDIELQRYGLPAGDTELLRAQGGGVTRGLNFTLAEVPTGVGGPLSPVVTAAASSGLATTGSAVSSNALELGVLNEPQTNLSLLGGATQSSGTAVPIYDPAIVGQLNWAHQTTQQLSVATEGLNPLVTNTTLANAGIQQGFASGAQASLNFDNSRQSLNALTSQYNPYTGSSLGFNVTQPLLRGFGASLNRRYIRIAGNEQRIASLLFRQQLIATVYGVIRLYTDFVALSEDEKVKRETLEAAEKLYSDVKDQVEEGTLAPVELTRANAQVFSAKQDLINATGLRDEQEAILKNVLTRTGNEDPQLRAAQVIATDPLAIPAADEARPIQDLIQDALANRPDLGQGRLQMENLQAGLAGSKNATLPELDLVGVMQNNGLAGAANPLTTVPGAPAYVGGYGSALEQVFARNNPTYGVGVQLTLPLHNRIAEADLARDELQVKQSEIRLRQLENQARLEVEDALIAMRRARSSYEAATQARKLQEESLAAEQAKFEVGASTAFFVIQYESLLTQARSTEVAAESSYVKARAALSRATGSILDDNRISVAAAEKGR